MAFDGTEWFGGKPKKPVRAALVLAGGLVLNQQPIRTLEDGRLTVEFFFTSSVDIRGSVLRIWREDGTSEDDPLDPHIVDDVSGYASAGMSLTLYLSGEGE